ncbi:MAG TPA: hypothetical protein ENJ79_11385 [Gammaproteobacteria bacterium]|nr:hypothetical protein [Gammaproteobacteria bacterium]
MVSDSEPPFHVHVASALVHNSFIRPAAAPDHAWGWGDSAAAAMRGAVFEAVENYANALWRQAQLLEPDANWSRPRFFALFQADGRILWRRVEANALCLPGQCAGRKVAVPLEAAISDTHPHLAGPALAPSRSGVGAGNSLAEAGASALAEVVERFTLARHWGAGLSGRRLAPEGFAPRLLRALAADGLEVDLVELPGFAGHRVVAARVRSEALPHEAVGAAARRSREAAVRGALGEALQVRVGLLASLKNLETAARARALAAGRQEVETAFDRALLAAMGGGRAARDRFFAGTRACLAVPGSLEVAYTDLTTPDLRATGCFVVRAVLFCDVPVPNGPGTEFAEPFVLA